MRLLASCYSSITYLLTYRSTWVYVNNLTKVVDRQHGGRELKLATVASPIQLPNHAQYRAGVYNNHDEQPPEVSPVHRHTRLNAVYLDKAMGACGIFFCKRGGAKPETTPPTFLPRDALYSTKCGLAIACRLFVCPSVTLVDHMTT